MNYISDACFNKNTSCENIQNNGFKFIHELFITNGWRIIHNQLDHVSYCKPGYETDVFDICIRKDNISVGIPIKNSPYLYRTFFTDYYHASEYVEERFHEFIQAK